MANTEHVALLKEGAEGWNKWKAENPDATADLMGATLQFANLRGADLSGADLEMADVTGADFSYARLERSRFRQTQLMGARFRDANLSLAAFIDTSVAYADLSGANLSDAILVRADFDRTIFGHANLTNALVKDSRFTDVDLSQVQGLDTVSVHDPSTIGLDTIYRSRGKIAESFLRDCGVPENFIRYIPLLVNSEEGLQFSSCFISYSSSDEEFAKQLYGKMRDAHLRVWFAPEDIQGGRKLHEQIDTAIRVHDKLLIVLSEESLQSAWVMDELRKGFKAERDTGKRKLFPVRLTDYETLKRWECRDSLSGKDLAEEVRQYFIPDFSHWKNHDSFEAAFTRLLQDLRTT